MDHNLSFSITPDDLDFVNLMLEAGEIALAIDQIRILLQIKHFEEHEVHSVFEKWSASKISPAICHNTLVCTARALGHFPDKRQISLLIESFLATTSSLSIVPAIIDLIQKAFEDPQAMLSRDAVCQLAHFLADAWRHDARPELRLLLQEIAKFVKAKPQAMRGSQEFRTLITRLTRTACLFGETRLIDLLKPLVDEFVSNPLQGDDELLIAADVASALGRHCEVVRRIEDLAMTKSAFPHPVFSNLRNRFESSLAIARASALWVANSSSFSLSELLSQCGAIHEFLRTRIFESLHTVDQALPALFDAAHVDELLLDRLTKQFDSTLRRPEVDAENFLLFFEDLISPALQLTDGPLIEAPREKWGDAEFRILNADPRSAQWEAALAGTNTFPEDLAIPIHGHLSPDVPAWVSLEQPINGKKKTTAQDWKDVLGSRRVWVNLHPISGRITCQVAWIDNERLKVTDALSGPSTSDVRLRHNRFLNRLNESFGQVPRDMAMAQRQAYHEWLTFLDDSMGPILSCLPKGVFSDADVIVSSSGIAASIPLDLLSDGHLPLFATSNSFRNGINFRVQASLDQIHKTADSMDFGMSLLSGSYLPDIQATIGAKIDRPSADEMKSDSLAKDQSHAPRYLRDKLQSLILRYELDKARCMILDRSDLPQSACTCERLRHLINTRSIGIAVLLVHGVRGGGLVLDGNLECFGRASIGTLVLASCCAGGTEGGGVSEPIARGTIPRLLAGGDRIANVFGFREEVHDISAAHLAANVVDSLLGGRAKNVVEVRHQLLRQVFNESQPVRSFFASEANSESLLLTAVALASSIVYSGTK